MTLFELVIDSQYKKKDFIKYFNNCSITEINDLAVECDREQLDAIKNQEVVYASLYGSLRKLITTSANKKFKEGMK